MAKVWTCPNCGAEMKKVNDITPPCYVCSNCGSSMVAEELNFDIGNVCPNCHGVFEDGECPNCGYDLGSDFD